MSEKPPRKPLGRPRVTAHEPSLAVTITVGTGDYDRACRLAHKHHVSVSSIFRQAFRVATRQRGTITDP